MPSWLPRALLATLAVVVFSEILVIAPRPTVAVLAAATAWMVLPGVVLARQIVRPLDRSWIVAWLVGPALGFGFSVFGVFLLWVAGIQNWLALIAGPGLTWLTAAVVGRFGGPTLRLPTFDRRDVVAVSLALLIVPMVTWAPYDHVREPVADGEAYRAYFTADFVWAMTVTAELSKGDVPPANPFLGRQPLRYYWMAHFLSGALYRNVRGWGITAEQVVLVDGLMFGLAAVAFLYGLARLAGAGPTVSLLAVAVGFLANSYEGADMMRAIASHGQPWSELKNINIDAVTRWFYKGMPVDGLQRMLLYQPHHLTGYMLALSALWLVGLAEDVTEVSVALGAGILLALGVLFSTFTALIVGCAIALLYAVRIVQQRAWRWAVHCAVLGAAPVAVGVGLSTTLGYTDQRHGSLLQLGLNAVAMEHVGRVLFLSFGPLLFAGIAGFLRWRWVLREGAAPAALVVPAFAFYFFTNVPDSGDVWVGWRSGHLLLIAFLVMGAAALEVAWKVRGGRPVVAITVGVAILIALPTVAIDVYNAQDITNGEQGPNFPWTLIITPQEREALDWIRKSTPQDAVVQVEPYVRGNKHWAYIPAFAERRAVAGLPGSMIPIKPYRDAADDVYWGIFRAKSADEAHAMARDKGINYLAMGRPELREFASGVAQIASRPDLFVQVFRNDEMTVFRVE